MRAARAPALYARRTLHPTKQSKIHLCCDPTEAQQGDARRTKFHWVSNENVDRGKHVEPQSPTCSTIEFRFWKARTPPPKIAVAHFLRACGVAQRSDFARMREETVNAHDSQHCGRWKNIRDRGRPVGGNAKTPGGPTYGRSYTLAPPSSTRQQARERKEIKKELINERTSK